MMLDDLRRREVQEVSESAFHRRYHVAKFMVERLGMTAELRGHRGCVNCIQWNQSGELLLSGSDDRRLIVWDALRGRPRQTIDTNHTGNIFSAKFLPESNDTLVASGAADSRVELHDLVSGDSLHVYTSHFSRVKRIEVARDAPHLIWSAAEDGLVLQIDIRADEKCPNILVNLNAALGEQAEAKCLAINPTRTNLMAVGANDEFIRLYDRRFMKASKFPPELASFQASFDRNRYLASSYRHFCLQQGAEKYKVQHFVAGHLPLESRHRRGKSRQVTSTYVTFSPDGDDLLVNMGGEQIYLFSVVSPRMSLLSTKGNLTEKVAAETCELPKFSAQTLELKEKANSEYNAKNFSRAIYFYNKALTKCSHPVLFSNRAAALLKRNWDGDAYSALRDCKQAVTLDRSYVKAHLRLVQCLVSLDFPDKAKKLLQEFKENFPEHSDSSFISSLESDIETKLSEKARGVTDEDMDDDRDKFFLRGRGIPKNVSQEDVDSAVDFEQSFCGHCNTTTDIKEASFFGRDGEFIAAGSDDGKFFIWEKSTSNIVRILEGDDSIVNCLQGHPHTCLLASSGIDDVVRLWAPFPESGCNNEREVRDFDAVSSANQRRMRADPIETILMNIGYDVPVASSSATDEDMEEPSIQCRPS